ncbi:uncharacterized protein TM35_000152260 [Trypanosoma theileri]|uniref:Thioredoxin-like fold domain-containing protein n=1 Tax=Trypanosoma theileri TaxID=67003 RepID=A0A1X0NVT0_9TRYP|nr:uncharacterized protein TM35_000152260 [Trypanosoma theileri]ORC88795.1 hypothetical protein TM35_000152260 [Trypanosoma theileri]
MHPSGLVVTTIGTLAVGIPMIQIMHMASRKKNERKQKMPSVKEATLAMVKKNAEKEGKTTSTGTAPAATTSKAEKPTPAPKKEVPAAKKEITAPKKETPAPKKEANTTNTAVVPVVVAKSTPAPSPSPAVEGKTAAPPSKTPIAAKKSIRERLHIDVASTWIRSHPFATAGAIVAVTITVYKVVNLCRKHLIKRKIMKSDDSEILQLYMAPPSFTFPRVARSCIALKTFLQLASIPHEEFILTDPSYSPIGCLPFIRYKGRCEGNVIVAMEYLTTEFDVKMDHCITDKEKAVGDAVVAMLEYSKEMIQNHSVYMSCNKKKNTRYARAVRALMRSLEMISDWISRTMGDWISMEEGGVREKKYQELQILREFQSVEHIVGRKSFLLGALPTTYDCAVYAVLKPIFDAEDITRFPGPLMYVRNNDVLTRYVNRVSHAVFPDIQKMGGHNSSRSSRSSGSRSVPVLY